jgi:hypothetical protein
MAKLVFAKLPRKAARTVEVRAVLDRSGRVRQVQTLDAASPSFGDELHAVFAKNVRKARRENKRVVGAADIAPRKS